MKVLRYSQASILTAMKVKIEQLIFPFYTMAHHKHNILTRIFELDSLAILEILESTTSLEVLVYME